MRVVLKKQHRKDCWWNSRDDSPWVIDHRAAYMSGDKNGGARGNTTSWIRMRCNMPECPALALVHHWDLSEMVQEALR